MRLISPGKPPAYAGTDFAIVRDGNAEMDEASGRGWAVLKGDELHGMIGFNDGDASGFVAMKPQKRRGQKAQSPW